MFFNKEWNESQKTTLLLLLDLFMKISPKKDRHRKILLKISPKKDRHWKILFQGRTELFVLGTCPSKQSGCPFDHSAAALERCIRSFTLLSKRELHLHGQLPAWSQNIKDPITHTRGASTSNHPDGPPTFNRNRDQRTLERNPGSFPHSRPYNK